jgi:hypothetical protein
MKAALFRRLGSTEEKNIYTLLMSKGFQRSNAAALAFLLNGCNTGRSKSLWAPDDYNTECYK